PEARRNKGFVAERIGDSGLLASMRGRLLAAALVEEHHQDPECCHVEDCNHGHDHGDPNASFHTFSPSARIDALTAANAVLMGPTPSAAVSCPFVSHELGICSEWSGGHLPGIARLEFPGTSAGSTNPRRRQPSLNSQNRARATGGGPLTDAFRRGRLPPPDHPPARGAAGPPGGREALPRRPALLR